MQILHRFKVNTCRLIAIVLVYAFLCPQWVYALDDVNRSVKIQVSRNTLSPELSIYDAQVQEFFSVGDQNRPLEGKNILFTSFRFDFTHNLGGKSSLDGVSLETIKWIKIFRKMGARIFCYAGEIIPTDFDLIDGFKVNENVHFRSDTINGSERIEQVFKLNRDMDNAFKRGYLNDQEMKNIKKMQQEIADDLLKYMNENNIDLVVSENSNAYPGNLPFALALKDATKGIKFISHGHDYPWERKKFIIAPGSNLDDLLKKMLNGKKVNTAVINTSQKKELEKFNMDSIIVPNVMDFDNPPVIDKEKLTAFRKHFSLDPEKDVLVLLPVRPIQRKNIDTSLELVKLIMKQAKQRMPGKNIKVMVTHPSGDEDPEYWQNLKQKAREEGIELLDVGDPKDQGQGAEIFELSIAYAACDITFFLSTLEGWGNGLIESFYYKKPIVVYPYYVYMTDIKKVGPDCIEVEKATEAKAAQIIDLLLDKEKIKKVVDYNYEVGQKFFSFRILREKLLPFIKEVISVKNNNSLEERSFIIDRAI